MSGVVPGFCKGCGAGAGGFGGGGGGNGGGNGEGLGTSTFVDPPPAHMFTSPFVFAAIQLLIVDLHDT